MGEERARVQREERVRQEQERKRQREREAEERKRQREREEAERKRQREIKEAEMERQREQERQKKREEERERRESLGWFGCLVEDMTPIVLKCMMETFGPIVSVLFIFSIVAMVAIMMHLLIVAVLGNIFCAITDEPFYGGNGLWVLHAILWILLFLLGTFVISAMILESVYEYKSEFGKVFECSYGIVCILSIVLIATSSLSPIFFAITVP